MPSNADKILALFDAVNLKCDDLYDETVRAYVNVATKGFIWFVLHPIRFQKLRRAHEDAVVAFNAMSDWRSELLDALQAERVK